MGRFDSLVRGEGQKALQKSYNQLLQAVLTAVQAAKVLVPRWLKQLLTKDTAINASVKTLLGQDASGMLSTHAIHKKLVSDAVYAGKSTWTQEANSFISAGVLDLVQALTASHDVLLDLGLDLEAFKGQCELLKQALLQTLCDFYNDAQNIKASLDNFQAICPAAFACFDKVDFKPESLADFVQHADPTGEAATKMQKTVQDLNEGAKFANQYSRIYCCHYQLRLRCCCLPVSVSRFEIVKVNLSSRVSLSLSESQSQSESERASGS